MRIKVTYQYIYVQNQLKDRSLIDFALDIHFESMYASQSYFDVDIITCLSIGKGIYTRLLNE
jgi:hypothetical protein